MDLGRDDAFVLFHEAIAFDNDAAYMLPGAVEPLLQGFYLSGDGSVDGGRHIAAGLCDLLPDLYSIPHLYQGHCGSADVHAHGQHHLGRRSHEYRSRFSGILAVRHMNAIQPFLHYKLLFQSVDTIL